MNSVVAIRPPEAEVLAEAIFPNEVLGCHKAIIGMSGSGKTVVGKKHVEQLLANPRRVVVIDPTGAWWGMRLMADGVTPSPYPLFIMGGEHGDRQLLPTMGGLLGQIVARTQISVIFDLSLMSQADMRRFTADFLTSVYEDNRKPLHLIIDEADEFAPQRASALKECKDALIRIMQRGRIRKIAITLITQRLAVIDKTALAQAKAMVIMQFTSLNDRRIVDQMVSAFPDTTLVDKLRASLASLKTGEGWFWCQPLNKLRLRQFPFIESFNSSATFSYDDEFSTEDRTKTVLPSLDLNELNSLLDTSTLPPEVEVESEEVKMLRASHAELQHRIEMMTERERQMVIDGVAAPDVTIDSEDNAEIDHAMTEVILSKAATGNALSMTDLILEAGIEVRPLAHRSLLRLLTRGQIAIRDGLVWPTTELLRRADRTDENFAGSVDIDLTGLVAAKSIMTQPERILSEKLIAAGRRLGLHVLPQVGMGAFIDTTPGIDPALAARARHAFAGRHVDYVLCNGNAEVKAIIELDDFTHDSVSDAMRDAVAAAAGIPTLRLLHTRGLTIQKLEAALRAMLAGRQPEINHPSLRRATLAA